MTKWLTIKEAAEKFNITGSSLYEWLDRHSDIKAQYCRLEKPTKGRSRIFIRESALLVIANMKDKFRGNHASQGNSELSDSGKKKIAERVIQDSAPSTHGILLQTAKILSELQLRIEKLESEKSFKEQKPKELMPSLPKSHDALRALLSMRIKAYAQKSGAAYQDLWNLLYRSFYKKSGINLQQRAIEKSMETLDFAEQYGHLAHLYKLASDLYRTHSSLTKQ